MDSSMLLLHLKCLKEKVCNWSHWPSPKVRKPWTLSPGPLDRAKQRHAAVLCELNTSRLNLHLVRANLTANSFHAGGSLLRGSWQRKGA